MFVTVYGFLQIYVCGTLNEVPDGKTAPGGHELKADYWFLIGASPAGGADAILNEESHPDVQLDNRHIMIRGETTAKVIAKSITLKDAILETIVFSTRS